MSLSERRNILQKLGAGVIVAFGLGLSAAIFSRFFPDALPAWIVGALLIAGFLVFAIIATVFFGGGEKRKP
jgi:hypothetical protein